MATITDPLDRMRATTWEISRGEAKQLAERYIFLVEKILAGERPVEIPWQEPRFQDLLLRKIGQLGQYKADADKLAVIKEVFGGNK